MGRFGKIWERGGAWVSKSNKRNPHQNAHPKRLLLAARLANDGVRVKWTGSFGRGHAVTIHAAMATTFVDVN